MNLIDLKCSECEHVFEYDKKSTMVGTPKDVPCPECKSTKTFRYFAGSNVVMDMAEGRLGNSKNGYETGITTHRSSRYGKYSGTRV